MSDLQKTPSSAQARIGNVLVHLSMILLLMAVVARAFISETPFHVSALGPVLSTIADAGSVSAAVANTIDRSELARMSFSVMLLAALALWIIGRNAAGDVTLRHWRLGVLMLVFAVFCFVSSLNASDKRAAASGFIEQVSLMAAAFLAVQLFGDRKRFVLLLVVLAAVGATLAAKAYAQYFVEIPDRVAQFMMYRDEQFRIANVAPGTPQAAAFQNRVTDQSVIGFFSLANLFASLVILVLLAAVGLAADKLIHARQARTLWANTSPKGELHTPTVAAWLTVLVAAAIFPVLILTRSRGGIIAGLGALVACGLIYRYRDGLARNWKKALIVVAIVVGLGLASVAAYGLKYDRLPSKTLTFRWHYWTASGEIIRGNPLWGVGPGNFPSAYLAVRRPAAEEAVKMPHNFVMHALAEYGLPAGVCYLGILAYVMIGICRPGVNSGKPPAGALEQAKAGYSPLLLVPLVAALPLGRVLFGGVGDDPWLIFYEVAIPTIGLLIAMGISGWLGLGLLKGLDLPERVSRIAVGCALAGFLLHNLIEFGLFMPGAATMFWVAAGACMARAGGGEQRVRTFEDKTWRRDYRRRLSVLLPVLVVAGAIWQYWLPVYQRTVLTQQMAIAVHQGRKDFALQAASLAKEADQLDPYIPAETARLLLNPSAGISAPVSAHQWAKIAVHRDPANSSMHHLEAQALYYSQWPDALKYALTALPSDLNKARDSLRRDLEIQPKDPELLSRLAQVETALGNLAQAADLLDRAAVADPKSPTLRVMLGNVLYQFGRRDDACKAWRQAAEMTSAESADYLVPMSNALSLDPNDSRLRISAADLLLSADRPVQAAEQIRLARWLSEQLSPESIERLSREDLAHLEMLQARATCLGRPAGANDE